MACGPVVVGCRWEPSNTRTDPSNTRTVGWQWQARAAPVVLSRWKRRVSGASDEAAGKRAPVRASFGPLAREMGERARQSSIGLGSMWLWNWLRVGLTPRPIDAQRVAPRSPLARRSSRAGWHRDPSCRAAKSGTLSGTRWNATRSSVPRIGDGRACCGGWVIASRKPNARFRPVMKSCGRDGKGSSEHERDGDHEH